MKLVIFVTAPLVFSFLYLISYGKLKPFYASTQWDGPLQSMPFDVCVISEMTRVARNEPVKGISEVKLWAAQGEYEAFQIVLNGGDTGLQNATVSISDLTNSEGATISSDNVFLYREHYVFISHSSPDWGGTNRPLPSGWYADALIPFRDPAKPAEHLTVASTIPFSVAPHQNQPVWVDLFVPRGSQPGSYAGTATVTTNTGTVNIPITLTVWRFSLPVKPSLKSSFGMHAPLKNDTGAQKLLLTHKVMPFVIAPGNGRQLIDEFGLSTTGLNFSSNSNRTSCTMDPAPSLFDIGAKMTRYPSDLAFYIYSADEIDPCPNLFDTVREWARNMHPLGVKNLAAITPTPLLYDDGTGTGRSAVDIWVVSAPMYNSAPERVAEVIRKGDEVWSYTALVQDSYSPKWEIDFAPINYRIQPGFISQSLGLTGLLYWRADLFTADPWTDVGTYAIDRLSFPGEGMLIYPGIQVGLSVPVPSMRLKWIREGIEDYEYIELAKALGKGEWALAVAKTIGSDWTNWTKDPASLENARLQIGQELDRLSSN